VLATLVIGLREGLEAALIVGIIAAFLKRNGKSLRAMWIGVVAAVLLSIAVGVSLEAISASLPQAQQEALESIIGAIAVVFVTGMIVWMNTHARAMRTELETSARAAIGEGTTWALTAMAFLAVLKEGFETSVFLLATFQASTSFFDAALGAVLGILIAVAIGYGIYRGGVKLNLGRFFKITGVFLIFVAAGLVISALRTAHEAGWINIGQQRTVDLSWLAPNGSIQAALITGVLGIPADPRVIEVLGWFLYLIPVLAYALWPKAWKPTKAQVPRVKLGIAAGLVVAAAALAIAVPAGITATIPSSAALQGTGEARVTISVGRAQLPISGRGIADQSIVFENGTPSSHAGVAATKWTNSDSGIPAGKPTTLTLEQVISLNNGRLPVGLDANLNPGPFSASWKQTSHQTLWTVGSGLLDATSSSTTIVVLSGGGLAGPRTLSAPPAPQSNWAVTPGHVARAATAIAAAQSSSQELLLWKLWLPLVFLIAAAALVASALRDRRRLLVASTGVPGDDSETSATRPQQVIDTPRSSSYAAK
jgi:high-affinity iron transporter